MNTKTIERPVRTDEQIIDQTLALAMRLLEFDGFEPVSKFTFYKEFKTHEQFIEYIEHQRFQKHWAMACEAQLHLTETDCNDAIANLENIEAENAELKANQTKLAGTIHNENIDKTSRVTNKVNSTDFEVLIVCEHCGGKRKEAKCDNCGSTK
jgi:hypothetical protein